MNFYKLKECIDTAVYDNFINYISTMEWNCMVTNNNSLNKNLSNSTNQISKNCRYVNYFGNGADIDVSGKIINKGWMETYWKVQSVITQTKVEELPQPFIEMTKELRALMWSQFPDFKIYASTFNIAVCNYYEREEVDTQEEIQEPDDTKWYLNDNNYGPLEAMITFYPDNDEDENTGFKIYNHKKDKWLFFKVDQGSVVLLPSLITKQIHADPFKRRITITFKSTYSKSINPLLNALVVSYHARYYRIPYKIILPDNISSEKHLKIYQMYKSVVDAGTSGPLQINYKQIEKEKDETYKSIYNNLAFIYGWPSIEEIDYIDIIKMVCEDMKTH